MEEETIVDIDTTTDEGGEEVVTEDVGELKKQNQSLYEQLKKAKGFERDDEGKWTKKETKTEVKVESKAKSDGLDYGQKAFLVANGIKGEAENKFVIQQLKESGKSLDELLENKYFQSELEEMRAVGKTQTAIISGKRSGGVATDSVEYWMTKPMEEIPQEMRIKVVNAQLKQGDSKGKFYNS